VLPFVCGKSYPSHQSNFGKVAEVYPGSLLGIRLAAKPSLGGSEARLVAKGKIKGAEQ
jgi:hypothetical protein